jgi:UDP-GlcNAc:undecaprenyl-phosphate GlcNAc-1-phosphate transferase
MAIANEAGPSGRNIRFVTDGQAPVLEEMRRQIENREHGYYCFLESHLLSVAAGDSRLCDILRMARGVFLDGVSTQKIYEIYLGRSAKRLPGPTFLPQACEYGQQRGWRHYFYGGAEGVAEKMAENLKRTYPDMIVAGTYSPPFRALTPEEELNVKAEIEKASPDVLWVGLGGPKQEYWMAKHLGQVDVPVMLGVGAAFDFHSGNRPWVPAWTKSLVTQGPVSTPAVATAGSSPAYSPPALRRLGRGGVRKWAFAGTCLAVFLATAVVMVRKDVFPSPLQVLWEGGLSTAFGTYSTSPTFWAFLGGSFVLTVCLTPLMMILARKVGAVDRGGHRKVSQTTMPLLGGLAVGLPFLVCCLLGLIGPTAMLQLVAEKHMQLLAILIGGAGSIVVGLVDDTHGMRVRHKFLLEVALALFVCLCGFTIHSVMIPFLGTVALGPVFGAALTILWIVGLMNALNIVDGLDGLAAGIALIAATGLGLIAAINGSVFVALLCAALVGSLAAFLLFNFHPARIFLGDTGSLFLGFTLATISLTGSMKRSGTVLFLAPMLALGLPIFEVALSMVRRYVQGLPISSADASHIHHYLLKRGLGQRRAVLILYGAALVCMLAALFSFTNTSDKDMAVLLPLGMYALVMLGVGWLAGYSSDFRGLAAVRKRNLFYQSVVTYVIRSLSSDVGALDPSALLGVARAEMRLSYLRVSFRETTGLIGVSGTPVVEESDGADISEPVLEIHVKSPNGQRVLVQYQHSGHREKNERTEIHRHLGHIFEHATISHPNHPCGGSPEAPRTTSALGGGVHEGGLTGSAATAPPGVAMRASDRL